MKYLLFATLFLIPMTVHASYTVCAGPTVHYSQVHRDSGIAPPKGSYTGEVFLSVKGLLKGKQVFKEGELPDEAQWMIDLKFSDEKELYKSGSAVSGMLVYSAKLVATKKGKPLAEEWVTCTQTWAFVP